MTAKTGEQVIANYTYSPDTKQEVRNTDFGNGQSVNYVYDEDGNLIAVKLGEETMFVYNYSKEDENKFELVDQINNLVKTFEESKLTVNDDKKNFIYSIENVTKDEEVENSFDGVITTVGDAVYTLKNEENKDTFLTDNAVDFTKTYEYGEDNELISTTVSNIKTEYGYNTDKLISLLTNALSGVTQSYGYAYDKNGNIKAEALTTTSKGEQGETIEKTEVTNYTYDKDNQLIVAENDKTKWTYSYDSRGNILNKKEYVVTVDVNGNKVYTEKESDTYAYDETWKDKLISYNGLSISYDEVGNPLNYMGHNLIWTMGRQPASFDDITYTYNENGIRTSKTSNGVTTKYYLDGTDIIEQTDGTNPLHFYYDSSNELIGFNYADNDYFYIKNQQGDITDITNSNGEVVASYTYDPWGKIIFISSSNLELANLNPFRYRGYYYDIETGLYYLQSRYYDPTVCRFINCDDVNYVGLTGSEINYNPFVYCENEPVGHMDLFGYWAYDVHAGYYKTASFNKAPNSGKVTDKKYLYKGISYIYLPKSKDSKSFYGTYYWATQCNINANCAKTIAYYCNRVDTIYSPVNIFYTYYQGWHFNINRGTNKKDSRRIMSENEQENAKKYFDLALEKKKKNKDYKADLEKGLQYLGMALHPIQDIYAHTNDKVYLVDYTYVNQYGVKTTIKYWSHVKNKDTDNVFLRYNQLTKTKDETCKILNSFYAKYKSIIK